MRSPYKGRQLLRKAILGFLCAISCASIYSQDVEQILGDAKQKWENPLVVSGSVGMQLSGYQTTLLTDRAPPFQGQANALLNLNIMGVQTPLSFVYSSGGAAFDVRLPSFAFAGISPRYRDYTLHLGDRTMQLGKYAFRGHSFRGVGGEVSKKKWYSRFFYGRLQRAQVSDFRGFENVNPLYRRLGWGGLVGYKPSEESEIEFSLFKGWDDPTSITNLDSSLLIFPAQNVIASVRVKQRVGARGLLDFTYSNSGYTARTDLEENNGQSGLRSYLGTLAINASTRWNNALEVRYAHSFDKLRLNVGYERIDPGYRTLGALFFQDDQENITAGASGQFAKNRIAFSAQGGLQRNNLDREEADESNRFIGAVNAQFRATQKLHFSLGITNFSSVNRQVRIIDPNAPNVLTELALTNLSLSLSTQYLLDKDQSLSLQFIRQNNQTITRTDQVLEQTNILTNLLLGYQRQWESMQVSAQLYRSSFDAPLMNQQQTGARLTTRHEVLRDQLSITASLAFVRNRQQLDAIDKTGFLWRPSLLVDWKLDNVQSISAQMLFFSNSGNNVNSFTETRAFLRYQARLTSK